MKDFPMGVDNCTSYIIPGYWKSQIKYLKDDFIILMAEFVFKVESEM